MVLLSTTGGTQVNSRYYTQEENEFIIANYSSSKVDDIAKHLGKTKKSVYKRAYALGLSKTIKRWDEERNNYVRECWKNGLQQKDVAQILGIRISEISTQAKKLGLHPWRRIKLVRYGRACVILPDGTRELEHRHVASNMLGRKLTSLDYVHHIDFDKHNNSPDNLHVFNTISAHAKCHKQFEKLGKELIRQGIVEFDRDTAQYRIRSV
jgi:hypothetical protein